MNSSTGQPKPKKNLPKSSAKPVGKKHSFGKKVSPLFKRPMESQLQAKIMKALKKRYPGIFLFKATEMFLVGIPDIIGCYMNLFFAIEVKIYPNKPTKMQDHVMLEIEKAGGQTCVVYDVKTAVEFIGEL